MKPLNHRQMCALVASHEGASNSWPLVILRQLEERGLVTVTIVDRYAGGLAANWIAELTEAGRAEVDRWLHPSKVTP